MKRLINSSEYVKAGKLKSVKYNTVGDLISALNKFPSDYPIRLVGEYGWGIDENKDKCFIKNIADYDDACEIEIF
jgi:hypothetical protein